MSDELRATVQQLRDAELRLEDDLAAAKVALAAAREREALAVLNTALSGKKPGEKIGETAAVIVEKVTAITAAIEQARSQRPAAIKAVWTAEAADLRRQAAEKDAAADVHAARTEELLAPLREHEGTDYVPAGRVKSAQIAATGHTFGEGIVMTIIPLSEGMRNEARSFEQQAMTAENRQFRQNDSLNCSTRDELLAAVRSWDAFKIGPALYALIDWLDEQEAAVRAKVDATPDRFLLPENRAKLEYAYTIVWQDGTINPKDSTVRAFYRERHRLIGRTDGLMSEEIKHVA